MEHTPNPALEPQGELVGMPAIELEFTTALQRWHRYVELEHQDLDAVGRRVALARLALEAAGYDGDHIRHLEEVGMPAEPWIAMVGRRPNAVGS